MADEPKVVGPADAEADKPVYPHQRWDVPSAIAWIMHRDRHLCDEIASRHDASLFTTGFFSVHETIFGRLPAAQYSLEDAKKLLGLRLEASDLVARGVLLSGPASDGHIDIPSFEWRFLYFVDDPVRAKPSSGLGGVFNKSYGLILLSADDVMRVWPEMIATKDGAPASTAAAAKRATRELAGLLLAKPNMKRAEAEAFCSRRGVSLQQARNKVWPDAREMARLPRQARPGRKRKAPSKA